MRSAQPWSCGEPTSATTALPSPTGRGRSESQWLSVPRARALILSSPGSAQWAILGSNSALGLK